MVFDLESLVKRVVELEKEVILLRKIANAAKWQIFYHPDDTIEMLDTAITEAKKHYLEIFND